MRNALSFAVVAILAMSALCEAHPALASLVMAPAEMASQAVQGSQTFTVIDFPPTPPTLPELLKAVDLVVLARVDATSRPQTDRATSVPKIRRIQDLTTLEVLKGEVNSPRIKVRQTGGTVIVDGREHAAAFTVPLFEVGDVVVLFLKRVGTAGPVYDITYGADGAVWSKGAEQRVELPQGLRRMPEFAGHPPSRLSELLASIRAANEVKAAEKGGLRCVLAH